MLAYTNEAREAHIENITRIIDKLGEITTNELDYITYRETVSYLSALRDLYRKEIK